MYSDIWNQEFEGLWKMVRVIFDLKDSLHGRNFWYFGKVELGSLGVHGAGSVECQ